MQISQSLQNIYTASSATNSQAIVASQQSLAFADASTTKQTDSINKSAYNYFELSEDVSQYTEIDPVQEQTNKDIVNYLSSLINNETPEGKKNLEAYDTRKYIGVTEDPPWITEHYTKALAKGFDYLLPPTSPDDIVNYENIHNKPKTTFSVRGVNGEKISGLTMSQMKDFLGEEFINDYPYDIEDSLKKGEFAIKFSKEQREYPYGKIEIDESVVAQVIDGYHLISEEEADVLSKERFKNLYSFTDEFATTDKFLELHNEYKDKKSDQMRETHLEVSNNWFKFTESTITESFFTYVDPTEYITYEVTKNAFSKSEAIEHFEGISNELKEHIANDNTGSYTMGSHYKNQMQETVNLYDKIASGLKDMWGFGDLDVNA